MAKIVGHLVQKPGETVLTLSAGKAAATSTEKVRRFRARRKAEGRCLHCGRPIARTLAPPLYIYTRIRCQDCRQAGHRRKPRHYEHRCPRCRKWTSSRQSPLCLRCRRKSPPA